MTWGEFEGKFNSVFRSWIVREDGNWEKIYEEKFWS